MSDPKAKAGLQPAEKKSAKKPTTYEYAIRFRRAGQEEWKAMSFDARFYKSPGEARTQAADLHQRWNQNGHQWEFCVARRQIGSWKLSEPVS